MNQIQIQKENKTLDKARLIATSKGVRKTSNRKIWIIKSQTTERKFYRVMYDDDLQDLFCGTL